MQILNYFKIKREVSLGEIFTAATFMATLLTIYPPLKIYSETAARDDIKRTSERAAQARSAAAEAMAKIERWQQHSERYYQSFEPVILDARKLIASTGDFGAGLDLISKRMSEERTALDQKRSDEQIETAYAKLYVYQQSTHAAFVGKLNVLKQTDEAVYADFRAKVDYIVRTQHFYAEGMLAAGVSNGVLVSYSYSLAEEMKNACNDHKARLQQETGSRLHELRQVLQGIIIQPDQEIAGPVTSIL